MEQITLGILAHVDAGKTTVCEGLLYENKVVSSPGRVDKKESFLDFEPLERKRGITIISKEAVLPNPERGREITLLDTPGHVDFVWESLACIEVMDAALLVIDSSSPISPQSVRLFNLLKQRFIPTFIFMNKTDLSQKNHAGLLSMLEESLDSHFVDFNAKEDEICENVSLCDEGMLEEYLENQSLSPERIKEAISGCKITPVYFGAALKGEGIDKLNEGLFTHITPKINADPIVYKITRDEKGTRLIHVKTGPEGFRVKEDFYGEKIEEIRRISGARYASLKEAEPGMLVAIRGPLEIFPDIRGDEAFMPLLEYELVPPEGVDSVAAMQKLFPLTEEYPAINLHHDAESGRILLSPMGDIQLEVLSDMIPERFGMEVSFKKAGVIYKEKVAMAVEGVGHFEPLRHYAEVHLLLEPASPGSGITVSSQVGPDMLSEGLQSQVTSTLKNHRLRGVITGSDLIDTKITLVAGRSHEKHTEGGDFREATLRALRQGLMKTYSILLEPLYAFTLKLPGEYAGKVMSRLETIKATMEPPEYQEDLTVIRGSFPVSKMGDLPRDIQSLSSGSAFFSMEFGGYAPVESPQEIVEAIGYIPEADLRYPCDSVFTSHGSSTIVPWYEVEDYMHLPLVYTEKEEVEEEEYHVEQRAASKEIFLGTEEIDSIINGLGGANKRKTKEGKRGKWNRYTRVLEGSQVSKVPSPGTGAKTQKTSIGYVPGASLQKPKGDLSLKDDYLLVDGYNIIFAWENLSELSKVNIDSARDLLVDILSEYSAFTGRIVILVFDAYKVSGGVGSVSKQKGINIVYTKEAETADAYIEKVTHRIAKKHRVTVATSDRLEQMIVWGDGAYPMSARDLLGEIERTRDEIREMGKVK